MSMNGMIVTLIVQIFGNVNDEGSIEEVLGMNLEESDDAKQHKNRAMTLL